MESSVYESRSVATWGFAIAGAIAVTGVVVGFGLDEERSMAWLIAFGMFVVAALVANFAVLKARVTSTDVTCLFGRGWLRRTFPLESIRSVEATRPPWYWGWGIRWTPSGWLWRSHGFDVVWLELDNGKRFGIGTQDPGGLVAAVRKRITV